MGHTQINTTRRRPTAVERRVRKQRLNLRLAGYTATAGAAVALTATAGTANADIVFNKGFTGPITVNSSQPAVSFDLIGGGWKAGYGMPFSISLMSGTYFFPTLLLFHPYQLDVGNVLTTHSFSIRRLDGGDPIGPSGRFTSRASGGVLAEVGSTFAYGEFVGARGYIGVRFPDPKDTTQTDYGWIEFGATFDGLVSTIHGWAYDDSGAPIAAGATRDVPEPSSLALWALGALGAAGAGVLRRWKKQG